jgi:hypothetical protein
MKSFDGGRPRLHLFMHRILEGRISPLEFIALIGSFSTLVLLYISLHVCFFNLSTDIAAQSDRAEALMEHSVRLTAQYNELAAPGRIIPLAREYGMRPGEHEEVDRLAVRGDGSSAGERSWAEATVEGTFESANPPEPRMAR